MVEKTVLAELDRAELFGRTVFALRGFGEFEVRWGIGSYGNELRDCRRLTSSCGVEEIPSSCVRCLISNRLEYGLSTLKMGTFCRRQGDTETSAL